MIVVVFLVSVSCSSSMCSPSPGANSPLIIFGVWWGARCETDSPVRTVHAPVPVTGAVPTTQLPQPPCCIGALRCASAANANADAGGIAWGGCGSGRQRAGEGVAGQLAVVVVLRERQRGESGLQPRAAQQACLQSEQRTKNSKLHYMCAVEPVTGDRDAADCMCRLETRSHAPARALRTGCWLAVSVSDDSRAARTSLLSCRFRPSIFGSLPIPAGTAPVKEFPAT